MAKSIKEIFTKERGTDPEMFTNIWVQWIAFISFLTLAIMSGPEPYIQTITALLAVFFIPFKPYQKELKIKLTSVTKYLSTLLGSILTVGGVVLVVGIVIWFGWKVIVKLADFIFPDKWTLMICETKLNNFECMDNSYVFEGFKSQKDCMLEGATRFSKEGFECGSNCKMSDYGLRVCKKICNKGGCN